MLYPIMPDGTHLNIMKQSFNYMYGHVETGFRDVAPMYPYNSAMALVYVHVQCTVPGYKSQRMYRNKLVLS